MCPALRNQVSRYSGAAGARALTLSVSASDSCATLTTQRGAESPPLVAAALTGPNRAAVVEPVLSQDVTSRQNKVGLEQSNGDCGPYVTLVGDFLRYVKMQPSLSVVADNDLKVVLPKSETVAQRVQRLQT